MSEQAQANPAQLRAEAEKMLQQALALEQEQKQRRIEEVRALINQYGLSKEELFPEKRGRGRGAGAGAKTFKTQPYYLNPYTGETAQRMGRKTQWLNDLIANGAPKSLYIISEGATYPPKEALPPMVSKAPAKAPVKPTAKAVAKPAAKAPAKKAAAKKSK